MSFSAKYPGFCDNCESAILVGDVVTFAETGFVVHEECTPKVERPTETCTTCWLIKPCACDD